MANVVSKLVDELKWGAMLGVMQGDLDKTRSMLNLVINQVDDAMQRRVKELAEFCRTHQRKIVLGNYSSEYFSGNDLANMDILMFNKMI